MPTHRTRHRLEQIAETIGDTPSSAAPPPPIPLGGPWEYPRRARAARAARHDRPGSHLGRRPPSGAVALGWKVAKMHASPYPPAIGRRR